MKGLDIGCGNDKEGGFIGLDMNSKLDGVDIVHEIKRNTYLPFKDNSFDKINLKDIVEHIDDIAWFMSEIHRVSVHNSEVLIQYPHYSGRNAYNDVTHRHFLGLNAFNHFIPDTKEGSKYSYYTLFDRYFPFILEEQKISFKVKGLSDLSYCIFGSNIYEGYVSRILPISSVQLKLRVTKNSLDHIFTSYKIKKLVK